MTPVLEAEIRIEKDYRSMIVTTADLDRFLKISRYLGNSPATSTWMVHLHMAEDCRSVRKSLRQMEKLGYVTADSNGSNTIYWANRP